MSFRCLVLTGKLLIGQLYKNLCPRPRLYFCLLAQELTHKMLRDIYKLKI